MRPAKHGKISLVDMESLGGPFPIRRRSPLQSAGLGISLPNRPDLTRWWHKVGEKVEGYRLYIDEKLIFDDWKLAKAFQEGTVLELSAGPHKIVGEEFVNSFVGGRLARWDHRSAQNRI